MEYLLPLASLALIQLLAVVSPGPSFVVVSRTALSDGAKTAGMIALGLGFGTILWACAAILGLALVLEEVAILYKLLKAAGGLYLVYIAVMVWRGSGEPLAGPDLPERKLSAGKALTIGTLTQLANPKVVIFFGSIFIAVLPQDAPVWVYAVAVCLVFLNEVVWYSLVAFGFSRPGFRAGYARAKSLIDRVMSLVLAGLGGKLLFDSLIARDEPA